MCSRLLVLLFPRRVFHPIRWFSVQRGNFPYQLKMAASGPDGSVDIGSYRVRDAPSSVYYVPNFITEEEADFLWRKVYSAPRPKWTQLSNRRLQNWGGVPHAKGMVQEPLPEWLQRYCQRVVDVHPFDGKVPNHVLVNEYTPGQGIMPHHDGPLYHPVVTTISLGSHTLLDFYRPVDVEDTTGTGSASLETRYLTSLLLEPRSLVVVTDDMYLTYLHGITERTEDVITEHACNLPNTKLQCEVGTTLQRDTRVSLTIRHVPKVTKLKLLGR